MQRLKPFLLVLLSILLGVVISVFLITPLIVDAVRVAEQGDLLVALKPTEALEKYEEAQRKWPLLKFDQELQNQIEKAKEEKEKVKENVAVTIFLKDSASKSDTQSLTQEIEAIVGVREVKFYSKEDVYNIYKERNKDDPLLLEFVSPDILPASMEVYLDDLAVKSEVAQLAKSKTFVDNIIETSDR